MNTAGYERTGVAFCCCSRAIHQMKFISDLAPPISAFAIGASPIELREKKTSVSGRSAGCHSL